MIGIPAGWMMVPAVGYMTLLPPEGEQAGYLIYQERMRPLLRLGGIVRGYLGSLRSFEVETLGAPERMTTGEGEHAALVEVLGKEAGRPVWRTLGVVFADDFYSFTSGVCLRPALVSRFREQVRNAALQDSLGLGTRRRRYEYAPPPDWEPIEQGLVTEWIPAGFPRDYAIVTAYPANIRQMPPEALFDLDVLRLGSGVVRFPPSALRVNGLTGRLFTAAVEGRARALAVLEDTRYTYALGLTASDAGASRHRDVFEQVLGSIQPIPPDRSAGYVVFDSLSHWLH